MAGGSLNPQYAPYFVAAARQYGIPANVLAGVADVETNGGANIARSSAGAVGLMQFEPSTAAGLGINPMNPRQAVFGAAKYLTQLGYHSNPLRALGAYNGGPGNPQYGYANQVMAEARRLAPAVNQFAGAGAPIGPGTSGAVPAMTPVTHQMARQRSADQGLSKAAIARAYLQNEPGINPWGAQNQPAAAPPIPTTTPTAGSVLNPVTAALAGTAPPVATPAVGAAPGLSPLAVSAPTIPPVNTAATNQMLRILARAHNALSSMTPNAPLNVHPTLRAGMVAGGFLPRGAMYVKQRADQGRDGQTNPGGPILADGNGKVVSVLSDPNGFGPRYPVIHFTSGRYAGRTLYFGHTLATVKPGQTVRAGQVIAHTGTSGVGNATVPGWFEIGFANSGYPGPFGQPTPF